MNQDISIDKRNKLINKFKRSMILIIDERSMISNELLGACEFHMKKTIYGGLLEDYDVGGIPIVLILGDDYQLPPAVTRSTGKGSFMYFTKIIFQNMIKILCSMKVKELNFLNC